jgi:hypothetical protein
MSQRVVKRSSENAKSKNHQIEIVSYENQNNLASLWGVFGSIFYSHSRQPSTVRKKTFDGFSDLFAKCETMLTCYNTLHGKWPDCNAP